MTTMTVELITGPWTYTDLESMPDDGRRYEIIDGVLLVSPAPIPDHQGVVVILSHLLLTAAPSDFRVLPAPLDVILSDDNVVEPDIVVAPRSDFGPKNLPAPPLLVVEVFSASTKLIDFNVKKNLYERAGIPSYWTVDPSTMNFVAYTLQAGRYIKVADLSNDDSWTATSPFPITIAANELRY